MHVFALWLKEGHQALSRAEKKSFISQIPKIFESMIVQDSSFVFECAASPLFCAGKGGLRPGWLNSKAG